MMRQPSGFSAAIACSTSGVSRLSSFQPSSEVKAPGGSGTSVHCSGPHLAHDLEQPLVRIALDIQLAARPPRPHQLGQRRHVGAADVALVGPRMHGQPVRPGIVRDARESQQSGTPVCRELRSSATLLRLTLSLAIAPPSALSAAAGTIEAAAPRQGAAAAAGRGSPSALGSNAAASRRSRQEGCSQPTGQAMDDRVVKSPQRASQGQKPGVTRYVLTIGLVLVVILFVVAYLISV